ncbi:MAG TPA: alanine--tRNA ligase [Phnomibacter sp.]|nr:alanine--tRNA ligase [Phnomibacter sp.]
MTASQIRQQFLDFFAGKGHTIVPSAPIVVKNDPTLMFTNAGMNQFKDYFLGNQQAPYNRAADTQKCLRVSGKHNDLEEVGVDTYHHTMFEMLGNWSFGDYFKADAIAWSWELLTEVYKLDKNRLYVTIFEGDAKEGLAKDDEAYNEWKKWIAEDRILLGNKKDNFWEMGDTGPCGPCTEIHVDCRPDAERNAVDGKTLVNADHPQVIEIWNNVFMQFNRLKDGSLQSLPAKHVDTGMGFERLVRVIQEKTSNYDTDIFTGTIAEVEKISGKKYDFGDSKQSIAFRVIADHIRAIAFTIADGQLPSNTGAGYVIRRILRRAVRYYYSYLDYKQPLLFQLIPVLAKQFENVFPELQQQVAFVTKVVTEEEQTFLSTLEKGLKRMAELMPEGTSKIAGDKAFELYDTYGFPLDLTTLIASEQKVSVDEAGFAVAMAEQKNRSRAAATIDTGDWVIVSEKTGDGFVGYTDLNVGTFVQKYRKVAAKGKELYQVVLGNTPFYAESGGQVGDKGVLEFGAETINVVDTKKENDLIVHFVDKLPTNIDGEVRAVVNAEERLYTMYNHTATHLMHAALRQVLGTHVAQKGSLVNDSYLRFDFSHFSKMTDEELRQVEKIVNDKIRENIPVVIKSMPKEEALKLGAMALFGEKYGDTVRVVTIDPNFSVELCGGTHVMHTGMIGLFGITSEAAVAAGVRRIEALTGAAAFRYLSEGIDNLKEIGNLLKAKDPVSAVDKLINENNQLKKHIEHLEARQLVGIRNELLQKDEIINQINFIGDIVEVSNADALKKLCFDIKNHLTDYVVVLCANIGGKPAVAVSIADNVVAAKGLDAGAIIKQHIAPLIKGGGGGQKNLATAGGQEAGNLPKVIETVKGLL